MPSARPTVDDASTRAVASAAPIVIVGMTAVGKTTVGRALAELTGLDLVDSDHEIERQTGRTCSEIIVNSGEELFRSIEEQVVLSLLDRHDHLITLGGGAWMRAGVRAKAKQMGTSVWLHADEELIMKRVRAEGRVIALNPDGSDRVKAMLEIRRPVYAEADIHILLKNETPAEAAAWVLSEVAERARGQR
ncbi:shikimate kinase [Actinoplanes sp. NPDC049802]|uniref:shikimate kinase n=1 Tax=Actinoplanes sp. NPDC049802 TaxID=3154742 RepID=UPI0033C2D54F